MKELLADNRQRRALKTRAENPGLLDSARTVG